MRKKIAWLFLTRLNSDVELEHFMKQFPKATSGRVNLINCSICSDNNDNHKMRNVYPFCSCSTECNTRYLINKCLRSYQIVVKGINLHPPSTTIEKEPNKIEKKDLEKMEEVLLSLPCGFETTYGSLKSGEKIKRCFMCDEEDLIVEDILNRPRNRLRLKERELEIEIENLRKLTEKISIAKQNPRAFVDKSFGKIFNQLDLRKEEVKLEFEKKLDDYYKKLRSDLEEDKISIIQKLEQDSIQEMPIVYFKLEKTSIENATELKEKIKLIESNLERIEKRSDELNELIESTERGSRKNLFFTIDNINMKEIFGDIFDYDSKFNYKQKSVFYDHDDSVWCIEKVNEQTILSGSSDKTIKLWDLNEAKCLKTFIGHTSDVYFVCMLKNGFFASCSDDGTIKIWQMNKDKCVKTLINHRNVISCLKFIQNDQLISCSENIIRIWNYETGDCLKSLIGHRGLVFCIEKGSSNTIYSGSYDFTIKIWNIETGENLKTLEGHTREVICLKLINTNKLASGSMDKTIKIWNLKSGECLKTLQGHTDDVNMLGMLKSGHLVSCSDDKTIKIWDLDSGKCIKTNEGGHKKPVLCLISNQDEEIITGSHDKKIIVWSKFI